ncbi:MAG: PASTA domain-containing protein [Chitinophagaceae bacterium]|nr:PASTA domain-containing protein [Chitinophagaceae bacterium]
MFKFLTHKPLWVNIVAVILLTSILILVFFGSLDYITKHGKYEKVPSLVGKNVDEARRLLESKGFEVEIQDSVYLDDAPKLSVIKQSPEGESMVKVSRTIYLTINRSQPPLVEMPNLVGFSIRNAEMYLENLGLKIGDTTFRPDIAKNAVLEQLYDGKPIEAGTKIFMGSKISFVLGDGIGDEEMKVPDLIGLTFVEAKILLKTMNVNFTPVADAGVANMDAAFVYRQNPEQFTMLSDGQKQNNRIKAGQNIDLWLSTEKPVIDSAAVVQPPPSL